RHADCRQRKLADFLCTGGIIQGLISAAHQATVHGVGCGASALSDLRFRPVGIIRRGKRRIRHRRMVSDAPRDASDNTLLFHRLADLIQ
ncbi:hypothetical protein FQ030_21090, partial [Escherichia coli]|nr:hypothetical protein [Escherichia coli]